jgi:peptide/nickel transport system substrate-binding protein
MRRRSLLGAAAAIAAAGPLSRPAVAQPAKTLRFVPQANLANPDPIWTTATVAINHGYMVWDTLYGIDNDLQAQPQMCAGQTVSDDGLTWDFTLRDGLFFHDGAPVRGIDCTTSINRWAQRNAFGTQLLTQLNDMTATGDKTFRIRLKTPFRQMLYALGATGCVIMPERTARTPASTMVTDYTGSGPFRFLPNEWDAGNHAAYAKFDRYLPRQEPPQWFAGGKVAKFDRVEWIVQPDPATAAAALQRGEVDWVEQPLIDLVGSLKKMPGVNVASYDKLGVLAMVVVNHLYPPFDKPAVLRAILAATNQQECVQAVVGEQTELGVSPVGFFVDGSPLASKVGLDKLGPAKDLKAAQAAIKAAGYNGEKITFMAASDQPALMAVAQVTQALWTQLGLNVDFQVSDWGTLVSRRAKQDPPSQGGWNAFCTTWAGLTVTNPGSSFPLQAIGRKGWLGWYDNPKMTALREDWLNAVSLADQQAVCRSIQMEAIDNPPFIPLGQWKQPWAYRTSLKNFVECGNVLFWGVERA